MLKAGFVVGVWSSCVGEGSEFSLRLLVCSGFLRLLLLSLKGDVRRSLVLVERVKGFLTYEMT